MKDRYYYGPDGQYQGSSSDTSPMGLLLGGIAICIIVIAGICGFVVDVVTAGLRVLADNKTPIILFVSALALIAAATLLWRAFTLPDAPEVKQPVNPGIAGDDSPGAEDTEKESEPQPDEKIILTCSNCGQRNRIPVSRIKLAKCGKCGSDYAS